MDYNTLNTSDKTLITRLITAKNALDDAKATYDKLATQAVEVVKNSGYILKDKTRISYYAPTTTTTVDSKRLREELPDVYNLYSKTSNRREYITVK